MTQHTPGPWTVETPALGYIPEDDPESAFDGVSVFDADGHLVAIMPIDLYPDWYDNARLVATAPELLAALSDFVSHYTELTDEHDGVGEPYFTFLHEEFHSVVEQARAALVRVTEPGG